MFKLLKKRHLKAAGARVLALLLITLTLPLSMLSCKKDPMDITDFSGETSFKLSEEDTILVRVVYPAGVDGTKYRSFAGNMAKKIKDWTGVEPEVVTDDEEEKGREILIGNTNREFSETAMKAVEKGNLSFAFFTSGGKMAIVSSEPAAMTNAFSYLDMHYKDLGFTEEEGICSFPIDLNFVYAANIPTTETPSLLSSASAYVWKSEKAVSVSGDSSFKTPVAFAMGSTNFFVAFSDGKGETKIGKFDLAGKLLKMSDALSADVTALAFDPSVDLLSIATGTKVTLLDGTSFATMKTATSPIEIEALSFDSLGMQFLAKKKGEDIYNYLTLSGLQLASKTSIEGMPYAKIAAGTVSLCGIGRDESFLYQLCRADGKTTKTVMTVQGLTGKNRYVNQVDLGGDLPLCMTKYGSVFCVLTSNADKSEFKIHTISPATVNTVEPWQLFNASNTAKIDTTGISISKQFELGSSGSHTVLQGACSDGKYGYFCLEDQKSNYDNVDVHTTVIVKYDMSTKKKVKTSAAMSLGHSNDACYNPLTNQIIVLFAGNGADGVNRYNTIGIVDADTLTLVETREISYSMSAISYNEYLGCYSILTGTKTGLLDANFRVNHTFSALEQIPFWDQYVRGETIHTQGIDCDSKYIYVILSAKPAWTNYLVAFDYAGNYCFAKEVKSMTYEGENIFHIGKTLYINCYKSGMNPVYKINIS